MEEESNKTNILMGEYFGLREKPGARKLIRMTPTKSLSNGGEGA